MQRHPARRINTGRGRANPVPDVVDRLATGLGRLYVNFLRAFAPHDDIS